MPQNLYLNFFFFRCSVSFDNESRQWKNDPNKFCYICGELTFAKEKRSITGHIKKLCKAYFHCDIGRPREDMGSACLLPYMCENIERMVSKQKCSHEVWCVNDLA